MMTNEQEQKNKSDNAILTTAHYDFGKGLNSYAFFKVNNRAVSQDLVQDVFMKTWVYLVKGGKIETMKAFLYHILNNLIVDQYRKHKTSSLDDLLEKGFEPSVSDHRRVFDISDGKVASLLIQRLSDKYRKVMNMRYIKCLSLEEIAILTSQSRNTVAVQIHRGLSQLKILFNHS